VGLPSAPRNKISEHFFALFCARKKQGQAWKTDRVAVGFLSERPHSRSKVLGAWVSRPALVLKAGIDLRRLGQKVGRVRRHPAVVNPRGKHRVCVAWEE
jgi:hypothetical protein